MNIANISTGFVDVPHQISINIYAQGCSLNCPNCHNPELQPFNGGVDVSVVDLVEKIKENTLSTWICWLGGDATFQPDDFVKVNELFQQNGYKVCLYTGRMFNQVSDILDNVDVVVDGPYIEESGGVDSDTTNQMCYVKLDGEFKPVPYLELGETLTKNFNTK